MEVPVFIVTSLFLFQVIDLNWSVAVLVGVWYTFTFFKKKKGAVFKF